MSSDFLVPTLKVSELLDRLGVTHAITGSIASSIHGDPLVSLDVDICLDIRPKAMEQFIAELPTSFYRSEEALRNIAKDCGLSNIMDMNTGLKIDLSVLKRTPYYQSVLNRRITAEFDDAGSKLWTVTPEDIILMKLEWRKDTKSQKQWDNALSVARTKANDLDFDYLRRWAKGLGVENDLEKLIAEAGI